MLDIGDYVESIVRNPDGVPVRRGMVIDWPTPTTIRVELDDEGYPEIDGVARFWRLTRKGGA